ncbi:MAG: class II D-tagatose-bisphosphate aldolase, non-catalytic subunit [Candidatus Omnitrophica bacterium]|nr:class II D-tagatose-bisphosphate aldolase, non-catalytic subunit [Candidatus Omnitrophota bacterium]
MNCQIPISKVLRIIKERNLKVTLLGIGPMSTEVIYAGLELARELDFPLILIASRNQIDIKEFGGGYVNGWDQKEFRSAIDKMAEDVGFKGLLYKCRDHGGPWQRDKEKKGKLPPEEAMDIAKKSFLADMEAGFNLLHIDPTKDPHKRDTNLVIERTIELIEFLENERRKRGTSEIGYEVGTEDIQGGLTQNSVFKDFLSKLTTSLKKRNLPMPDFIVGQTGTLVKMTENVGDFSSYKAKELVSIAQKFGIGFKEHNADYLDKKILEGHPSIGITASNVAPEFGVAQTKAYLKLAEEAGDTRFISSFEEAVVKSNRWQKWLFKEDEGLTPEALARNKEKRYDVTETCGHYILEEPEVKESISNLFKRAFTFNPERFVRDSIKAAISNYVTAFNLKGLTSHLS